MKFKLLTSLQERAFYKRHESQLAEFDLAFYRLRYRDLSPLGGRFGLTQHYVRHGAKEGRFANPEALIKSLEATHAALPPDFDPDVYRALNEDLTVAFTHTWQFTAHYLEFGRSEGRRYSAIDDDFADEFADFITSIEADITRKADALEAFLSRHGLSAGPWLSRFLLTDFSLANTAWLTPPSSRAEALHAFVTQGVDRLAPIAMNLRFDPDFYRLAYASHRSDAPSDQELYRLWLSEGFGRDEAPNEAFHLARLGSEAFPASFDEAAYRTARKDVPPSHLRAFQHFVFTGFVEGVEGVVSGPGADEVWEWIGRVHVLRRNPSVAVRAFDTALAIAESSRRHHARAEALGELDDQAAAAQAYESATHLPGANAWSFVHAATLWSKLGQHDRALAVLVRRDLRELEEWRQAAAAAVRGRFDMASRLARTLYAQSRRAEADAAIEDALAETARHWQAFGFLPGRLPVSESGPILILANLDLPQCVHYRVEQKRRELERGGWRVEIHDQSASENFIEALMDAQAAIFYRTAAFPDIVHAILHARALGVPTFYEVDDLIFDSQQYPDPFESFEGQITPEEYAGLLYGVPLFRGAMALCDGGIASTPALAEAMRPIVRSGVCHVLRNGLDQRNDAYLSRPAASQDGPVAFFYGSGTKAHNADFNRLAVPGLLRVFEQDSNARLVIAGYLALDDRFDRYSARVRQLGFTPDVDAYWEALSSATVNLAVLAPGRAADAKSEIKWLEAAMLGIPSIVSNTETYRTALAHGEDVLIADDEEGWSSALDRMARDPALRERIGRAAREKARRDYAIEAGVGSLRSFLSAPAIADSGWAAARAAASAARDAALARREQRPKPRWSPSPLGPPPSPTTRPSSRAARKPRVLVVNVFFPPQTIGGATRVVRDNIDYFLDRAGDDFDFLIAAADDGAEAPYRTRIDAYRGVPVLRIAPPQDERIDWRATDPVLGGVFDAFLARVSPDVVHFHCVQRLTASVVEAAQRRSIPSLVTVHDGWWVSDHQFLTDEDGRLQLPTASPLDAAKARGIPRLASLARRQRFRDILGRADKVLAVSESFAEIYRRAGIANATALPNGLPVLPAAPPRTVSPDGRVRLGHLGGRSHHKGATLLEAVLRGTDFANLHLTIVDLAQSHGHARDELWGTTPVRIIGKVPQESVADLYACLDVLVAPSTWPESFGLVAREARASGLWVIASDRGAMAEGVVHGADGFVVDVTTPEPLRAALFEVDREPRRFTSRPDLEGRAVRTADDQAAELLDLYARMSA